MKRNSLGWWLAASNVAIVLLVAAGISYFAIDMLRDLADSQQKIRVQLAGANSRAEITRMAEDTLTYARVLAERPPLRRLIAESGREGLAPFLRRFCETSELDACAVFDGAQVVAASGVGAALAAAVHAWPRSRASASWRCRPAREYSVVGAVAKLPAQYTSFSVMVVRLLDDELRERAVRAHAASPVRHHQLPRLQRRRRSTNSPRCIRRRWPTAASPCSASTRWACTPRASRCSPRPARASR